MFCLKPKSISQEEELAQKLAEQEAKNEKEIRGMEMKSKGLKETLLQVTQENTSC